MNMIHFRGFTDKDLPQIIRLVSENNLPVSDIVPGKQFFVVAEVSGRIIACAALEQYGENGLFRSLAVSLDHRNMKIGKDIVAKLMTFSKENNISQLYLLTTTADLYFKKAGWKVIDRTDVPDDIRATSEFSSICPSTAICMVYQL